MINSQHYVCLRPCVSSSSGYHGSWVTLCCSARARTRRVPSAAAAPSFPPAPTRRGTNPPAWSSDAPAAPTLSAGETRGLRQPIGCDRYLRFFFSHKKLWKSLQLHAACFADYYQAGGGTNQWNQLLKCLIGDKSSTLLGQNCMFDW